MIYKFSTTDLMHAKACLLLYAIYKSRDNTSSLMGKETWDRFQSYIKFSAETANNVAEFAQTFADKANTKSIVPKYLDNFEPRDIGNGEKISIDGVINVDLSVFEEPEILKLFRNETLYLSTLVRWRIDVEKLDKKFNEEEE